MHCGTYPSNISSQLCIYFLRNSPGAVPVPISQNDACSNLPKYFDFGILNSHPLYTLNQMLSKIYTPLLSYRDEALDGFVPRKAIEAPVDTDANTVVDKVESEKAARKGLNVAKMRSMLRDEFLITMQKFVQHIDLTIRQIEGEVRLEVPADLEISTEFIDRTARRAKKCELPDDVKFLEEDDALVSVLEGLVYGWEGQISEAIEVQNRRMPKDNGPIAEIDYWKERNISLSGVFEQTKEEKIRKILAILVDMESPAASSFENQRLDLSKLYSEAKDNVRFLSTLERHFKNICYGSSFHVVAETLPSMMNALRMIWIISRHYNKDERMVPLMESIAHELTERVSKVINVRKILK